MVSMFDLHMHILPGVDDGAKTMEEAVEMARVASENGTEAVLATPHRRDVTERLSVQEVQELMTVFKARLEGEGIGLRLLLGMENHLDIDLPGELSSGRALPMNGTRYALVELPFFGSPNYLDEVLFQIQVQGITPVLAHPERIEAVQKNPELLVGFVERGMLSQVTAGSFLGYFGGGVKRVTHTLLRRGLIHLIASDAHVPRGPRSPNLTRAVAVAAAVVGQERANAMVVDTPRAILDDMPVEVEPPRGSEAVRRWWAPWRR